MTTEQETPTGVVTLARANEVAGTGHFWIYAGFVHAVRGQPVTGDLVDVVMPSGRFYARGLYNPASKIRVRILTFQEEPITPAFWRERIAQAVRLRTRIASETTAYRLIYGEADQLPGLIVDRYDDMIVCPGPISLTQTATVYCAARQLFPVVETLLLDHPQSSH